MALGGWGFTISVHCDVNRSQQTHPHPIFSDCSTFSTQGLVHQCNIWHLVGSFCISIGIGTTLPESRIFGQSVIPVVAPTETDLWFVIVCNVVTMQHHSGQCTLIKLPQFCPYQRIRSSLISSLKVGMVSYCIGLCTTNPPHQLLLVKRQWNVGRGLA